MNSMLNSIHIADHVIQEPGAAREVSARTSLPTGHLLQAPQASPALRHLNPTGSWISQVSGSGTLTPAKQSESVGREKVQRSHDCGEGSRKQERALFHLKRSLTSSLAGCTGRRFRQKCTHVSATGEAPESSSRDREDVSRPDLTEDGGAAPPVSRTEKEEIGPAETNSALEVNCGLRHVTHVVIVKNRTTPRFCMRPMQRPS